MAREYKRRNLPISVIVADIDHWPAHGDWKFNPELWPDPAAMIEELDSMGIELVVSVWPTLDPTVRTTRSFERGNYTIRPENGVNLFLQASDDLTYVDVTHPGPGKHCGANSRRTTSTWESGISGWMRPSPK